MISVTPYFRKTTMKKSMKEIKVTLAKITDAIAQLERLKRTLIAEGFTNCANGMQSELANLRATRVAVVSLRESFIA